MFCSLHTEITFFSFFLLLILRPFDLETTKNTNNKQKIQAPPPPTTSASTSASPPPDDGPGSLYPPTPACPLRCVASDGGASSPPPGRTVPFDTRFATGSDDLPLDDPLLARPGDAGPNAPEQVKVQLAVDGGVVISWVTGEHSIGEASELLLGGDKGTDKGKGGSGAGVGLSPLPPSSVVRFGKSPDQLDRNATSPHDPILVPGSPDLGADGAVGGLPAPGSGSVEANKSNNKNKKTSPSSPLPPQPRRYLQSYPSQVGGTHSYLSGWNHHVLLRSPSQITPGERVYYQVGGLSPSDGKKGGKEAEGVWSEVMSFVAPPRSAAVVAAEEKEGAKNTKNDKNKMNNSTPSSSPYPLLLSFVGDIGTTENSTSTLRHIAETSLSGTGTGSGGKADPEAAGPEAAAAPAGALFVVGDLVYADNYEPDGSHRNFMAVPAVNATYQVRDVFFSIYLFFLLCVA